MSKDRTFLIEAPIAIVWTDLNGNIIRANPPACQYLGGSEAQLCELNIAMFSHPEEPRQFQNMFSDPESAPYRLGRLQDCKQRDRYVRLSVSVEEEECCWFLESRDEIEQMQQELRTLGHLPRAYGHDMNNLLTVILSAAEMIKMDFGDDLNLEHKATLDYLKDDLNDILIAAQRATKQTKLFMKFGRDDGSIEEPLSIKSFLQEHETLLQDALGAGNQLQLQLCEDVDLVHVFPNTLLTALLRLCVSKRSAQPESFVCQTDIVELEEPFASQCAGVAPGSFLALSVFSNQQTWSAIELQSADHICEVPRSQEALEAAWESVVRAKGSIVQRDKPTGTSESRSTALCTTLYFRLLPV